MKKLLIFLLIYSVAYGNCKKEMSDKIKTMSFQEYKAFTNTDEYKNCQNGVLSSNHEKLKYKIVNVEKQKKGGSVSSGTPPKYTLYLLNVAIIGNSNLTKQNVSSLLKDMLDDAINKYKYADAITINLFQSESHIGQGFIAYAEWWPLEHSLSSSNSHNISNKNTYKTKIKVNNLPEKYAAKSSKVNSLSLSKQQEIYKEIIRAESRATKEADRKFPGHSRSQLFANSDENNRLMEKYRREVASKHNMSYADLKELMTKAFVESWPLR